MSDLYYSLGYALQVRDEPEYLDEAVAAYQRAVEIYPALRKGWAFFNMGLILERQGRIEEAQQVYEQVPAYDFANLALAAEYRMVVTNLKLNRLPLDPLPVYHFIRYGNRVRLNILDPFGMDLPEESRNQISAGTVGISAGNPATAVEYITEYLRTSHRIVPHGIPGYAATGIQVANLSGRWKSLQDAFAPRVYLNHSFRLLDDGTQDFASRLQFGKAENRSSVWEPK